MNKMRPSHPGEILCEEFLVPLGLSASALALELKVPAPRINDIVHERRAVTPDTALRLSPYFRTSPEFWMYLKPPVISKPLPGIRARRSRRRSLRGIWAFASALIWIKCSRKQITYDLRAILAHHAIYKFLFYRPREREQSLLSSDFIIC